MFYLAPLRNGVVQDVRNQIYRRILILPLAYFSEQRKGDIMSRITNDVSNVEWSIMQSLEMLFREPISIIFFSRCTNYYKSDAHRFCGIIITDHCFF